MTRSIICLWSSHAAPWWAQSFVSFAVQPLPGLQRRLSEGKTSHSDLVDSGATSIVKLDQLRSELADLLARADRTRL